MDPNKTLQRMLQLSKRMIDETKGRDGEPHPDDALELAELVEALDNWIRRGGSFPSKWWR